jgi:uncharacterized damage-inducible protein DinB
VGTTDYMKQSLRFLHEAFRGAGEGLTDEQLHHSPEGESHSIAWVQWHAARIEDLFIHQIFQKQRPEWETGGWAERTGLPAKGFGTGQPTAEAKALHIADTQAFAEYARRVAELADRFLEQADDATLATEVKVGERTETIGESINLHLLTHLNGHRGEVNLIRGSMGFQPVLPGRGG